MLKVKKCKLGWGITDGKKWFFWAYTSEQKASEVLTKINSVITSKPKLSSSWGEEVIKVNISYPEPMELIK